MDNMEPMKMSYELLKEITHDFSEDNFLGSGAYGNVYKGTNANGKEVAVKVLNDMAALDDKNFRNEFQNLAKLDHQNIVKLEGYCQEYSEPEFILRDDGIQVAAVKLHVALCFEYINNGSIGDFISDEKKGLPWDIRYRIIKGICEGLKHLHERPQGRVLHLDLKPANILLNEKMVPKIADFGFSTLIGDENTKRTMNAIGTEGYQPPEYRKHQLISPAFDIYSLGVIIQKIMVGRERYNEIADKPHRQLVKLVHTIWKERLQETVGQGSLLDVYCKQVKTCIELASKCLMEKQQERPKIQQIVATLNKTDEMSNSIPLEIGQFNDAQSVLESRRRITSVSASESDGEARRPSYTENRSIVTIMKFPYKLLKEITDDFSEKRMLGRRAFGAVYKGVRGDGLVIAVKILHAMTANLDGSLFRIELANHVTLKHENIVQLVGYCTETELVFMELDEILVAAEKLHRAVCYEYMQNGALDQHISGGISDGLDWCTRYKIIKGTCDGLRYLHEELSEPILHLDLKPSNILLDENMTPKISDFGCSRLLRGIENTKKTMDVLGTRGYLPPEFINHQIISTQFDIFSLGVIILRVVAGTSGYYKIHQMTSQLSVEHVLKDWKKRLQPTLRHRLLEGYCSQVKRCTEIAVQCVERDRHKRPSIGDVVRMIDETEEAIHDASKLLDVHPMELRLVFKRKKYASCLLQLCNKEEDTVAFRLVSKSPMGYQYHTDLPLHGMVPPRCTYTLALTTSKQPQRPHQAPDNDEGVVLQSAIMSSRWYHEEASLVREFESLFNKAQESDDDGVQEVTLNYVCPPLAEEASSKLARPEIEIITSLGAQETLSIEVHPIKPWIMTTHERGNLRIWNYQTMTLSNPIKAPEESVYIAKFIKEEEWVVAGDGTGFIHVCSYDEYEDYTSFHAHDGRILSLAVHPTDSNILSSSHNDHLIKLWHWDEYWDFNTGPWACTRTFDGHSNIVSQVVFNPDGFRSFASASCDGTVKIWDLKSDVGNTITLDTHQDGLLSIDYIAGDDRQHLITGSKDRTAQIWDLEIKGCREYLQGHAHRVTVVYCHQELQKLFTGSLDGTIQIWDSTTYRLENIIALNLGAVSDVGYIEDLQRIVIGCHKGIALVEIKFDDLSIASEG